LNSKSNVEKLNIPPKKRVLCVTSNYPRWQGDSTTPFVHHLAQDLKEFGWEVDVLAPHAMGAAQQEILDGISIERFKYLWPERTQTVCYQGGALMNLQNNRLNYLKLPALVFFEWLAIFKLLMSGKYDLLHSHWILPQGFTGVLAAIPLKIPHVITVHGSDAFALNGKYLTSFKQFSLVHADAVTVNSTATRQQVLSIAPTLSNLNLIPMGISTTLPKPERSAILRSRYIGNDGPLLIFVGRLVKLKGVDDLLHAVSLLKHNFTDIRLLILGEGPFREELESLSRKLRIEKQVFFTGWVEPEEVVNYLTAADIFIGPSKNSPDGSTEAQGLTFIESMQAGTPVIATDVGGIVDVIQHEQTGLLIPQCSPDEIASGVLRLTVEQDLKEYIVKRARSVAQSFTREASAKKLAEVFAKQISIKKRPGESLLDN
jgi:phosphatidylinositol alpha-1,6-mannosyltransferase|tara:strand:+ start:169738 stop:171027 length:1290 start_codon:yes stop_codon:yes gene_type:complete